MGTLLQRIAAIADNEGLSIGRFEAAIGASKGVLSRALQNNTDIQAKWIAKIVENYPQYRTEWLITGEGEMTTEDQSALKVGDRGIPLIPTSAFAGYGTLAYDDLLVEDYYIIREFCNADFLLRVKGDSMSPRFKSGDIIACKKIEEITFWQWHCIYAICTKSQGVLIKRVEEGTDNESLCLVSENPKYTPFQLPKDDIIAVALVLGAIIIE